MFIISPKYCEHTDTHTKWLHTLLPSLCSEGNYQYIIVLVCISQFKGHATEHANVEKSTTDRKCKVERKRSSGVCKTVTKTVAPKTTVVAHNNFEQTFTFQHLLFGHFIQEVNYIWYLGGALSHLPAYHISLVSCVKWPNSECLKVSICSKLSCENKCGFPKLSHI